MTGFLGLGHPTPASWTIPCMRPTSGCPSRAAVFSRGEGTGSAEKWGFFGGAARKSLILEKSTAPSCVDFAPSRVDFALSPFLDFPALHSYSLSLNH